VLHTSAQSNALEAQRLQRAPLRHAVGPIGEVSARMNRYLLSGVVLVVSACGLSGNGIYHRLYFSNPTVVPVDVPTLVTASSSVGLMVPVSLTCSPGPCEVTLNTNGNTPGFLVTPQTAGRHLMVAIVRAPDSDTPSADELEIEAVPLSGLTLKTEPYDVAPISGPLEVLRGGGRVSLCPEARMEMGREVDASAATFTVDHEEVLKADALQPGARCRFFSPIGHGVATVVARFGGHTASVEVQVYDPSRTRSVMLQELAAEPWSSTLTVQDAPVAQLSMRVGSVRSFQVVGVAEDGRQAVLKASCLVAQTFPRELMIQPLFLQHPPLGVLQLSAQAPGGVVLVPDASCGLPRDLLFRITIT